jgi:hypothetical protein
MTATIAYRRSAVVDRLSAAMLLLALSMVTTGARAGISICGGTRIPMDTSVFNKPFANLTLSGNNGSFLIDTGATQSQIDMRRYGVPEDSKISLPGFSLPLVQGGVFTATDLRSFAAPLGGELGTVGTDFLSLRSNSITNSRNHSSRWGGKHATRSRCDALVLSQSVYQATTKQI